MILPLMKLIDAVQICWRTTDTGVAPDRLCIGGRRGKLSCEISTTRATINEDADAIDNMVNALLQKLGVDTAAIAEYNKSVGPQNTTVQEQIMGLHLHAYSKLTPSPDGKLTLFDNFSFAGRIAPFRDKQRYNYELTDDYPCGSYSAYNEWRNQLAKFAGYPATYSRQVRRGVLGEMRHDEGCWLADGGPFYELINFSDCTGVLGTVVCQKLLADFQKYADSAKTFEDGHMWIDYAEIMKLLALAADGGCLVFA